MKNTLVFLVLFFTATNIFAFDYSANIDQAQSILKNHANIAGCGDMARECRTLHDFKKANTMLALLCSNSPNAINVVRLFYNENSVGEYTIERGHRNGVNTRFSVKSTKEVCAVLAVRRAVHNSRGGFVEVVYTPYSPEIDSGEMRDKGMRYLTSLISSAQVALLAKGVMSRAFPNELVATTVPTWVAVRLALIEHIDPSRIEYESIDRLMGEVAVIIAANKTDAYRHSVSTANARGLLQFTPRTYRAVHEKYVPAGLVKDFIAGTQDHMNAAQATLLLFDLDMENLSDQKKSVIARDHVCKMEYLAASYNGGPVRATNAMRTDCTLVVGMLHRETRGYISSLRRVHKKLRFESPFL